MSPAPNEKGITRTLSRGVPESIRLTNAECLRGMRLAQKHRIVGESGNPSWRATVRAVLSGHFDIVPAKKKPEPAPVIVSPPAPACPPERDEMETLIDRL